MIWLIGAAEPVCVMAQAAHYVLRSGEQRGPSSGAFASLASSLYGPSTRLEPQVAAA